ncbi:MAG: hypothetical protein HY319_08545 [Armatimonadetes bacterium]|nr:hypothetical protein [Armatimonadota bacterium]
MDLRAKFKLALLIMVVAGNLVLSQACSQVPLPGPPPPTQGSVLLGGDLLTTIPVGASPMGIVADGADRRLFVANSGSNNVSVIDASNDQVTATITVGRRPIGLGLVGSRPFPRLMVANEASDSLTVIDPETLLILTTIGLPAGSGPRDVSIHLASTSLDPNDTGYLAVSANQGNNTVTGFEFRNAALVEQTTLQLDLPDSVSSASVDSFWVSQQPGAVALVRMPLLPVSPPDFGPAVFSRPLQNTGTADDVLAFRSQGQEVIAVANQAPANVLALFTDPSPGDPIFQKEVPVGVNPEGLG